MNANNITYSVANQEEIYGTFYFIDFNEKEHRLLLSTSGAIEIDPSIEYFNGIFVIYDNAGNIVTIEVEYNRSSYEPSNPIYPGDIYPEDFIDVFSFFSLLLPVGIIICVGFIGVTIFMIYRSRKNLSLLRELNKAEIKEKKILYNEIEIPFHHREDQLNIVRSKRRIRTFIIISVWISFALIQTIIFGIIIVLLERFNLLHLVVLSYNQSLIYHSELALVFFIIFFSIDILGEGIRYKIYPKLHNRKFSQLITSLIISSFQFFILISFLSLLSEFNIIGFILQDTDNIAIPLLFFYIIIGIIILIAEFLVEFGRRRFNYIDKEKQEREIKDDFLFKNQIYNSNSEEIRTLRDILLDIGND